MTYAITVTFEDARTYSDIVKAASIQEAEHKATQRACNMLFMPESEVAHVSALATYTIDW